MTTAAHPNLDTIPPPEAVPLDAIAPISAMRAVMLQCLHSLERLEPNERARVIRSLAALFGVET